MRHLDWQGCFNVRDLGGLRTADGRRTRWRAVVRSDAADRLTGAGWSALHDYGVRTVVDLRNDDERTAGAAPYPARPAGLVTVHVPLDGLEDTEFWGYWGNGLHGTPLYYPAFLRRFPQRIAAAVAAVADARPGAVLVHCGIGRDRTGLVAMVLLALAGVPAPDIVDDHLTSTERLRPAWSALGLPDQEPAIDRILAEHGTTARDSLLGTIEEIDPEDYLRSGGLTGAQLAAVHARLLD
jgi:hypothetical protein